MRKFKRSKLSKRHSKKLFRKTAKKVNKRNYSGHPMRGGIRL